MSIAVRIVSVVCVLSCTNANMTWGGRTGGDQTTDGGGGDKLRFLSIPAQIARFHTHPFAVSGGKAPYHYSILSGTGQIDESGNYRNEIATASVTVKVQVTDSSDTPQTATATFTVPGPGTLDSTFGTAGKLLFQVADNISGAAQVALDSKGRIVVGGWTMHASCKNFAAARLDANGSFDSGFGSDGKTSFDISHLNDKGGARPSDCDGASEVKTLVIDPSDRIILAGSSSDVTAGNVVRATVARVSVNGTLDPLFGAGGFTVLAATDGDTYEFRSTAVHSSGEIIAVGVRTYQSNQYFAHVSFHDNGGISSAYVYGNPANDLPSQMNGLGIDSQGRVLAGGTYHSSFGGWGIRLERFLGPAFVTDASNFSSSGRWEFECLASGGTPLSCNYFQTMRINAVKVLQGDRILVAGTFNSTESTTTLTDFTLTAINSSGGPDLTSFSNFASNDRRAVYAISSLDDEVLTVTTLDRDNIFVAAGYAKAGAAEHSALLVGKLSTGEQLFQTSQIFTGPITDRATSAIVDSEGRIVIAGAALDSMYVLRIFP